MTPQTLQVAKLPSELVVKRPEAPCQTLPVCVPIKLPSELVVKIAICVFGCITIPKYCLQLLKIQETWAKRAEEIHNIPVYYFVGEEQITGLDHPEVFQFPSRIIYLPGIKNDYLSASYKQNLGIKYILDNNPDIDFVFVCGTDTYLNIDSLIHFLSFMNPQEKLYIGGHYDNFDNTPSQFDKYISNIYDVSATNSSGLSNEATFKPLDSHVLRFFLGGAGFVLSRGMMDSLYPFLESMTDVWLSNCNQTNTKQFDPACDVCLSFYIHCLGGKFIQYFHRFYECNHIGIINISKLFGYNRIYHCCHDHIHCSNIISCHNMSLNDFDNFTTILRENDWFNKTRLEQLS
jgi:hypothetical protein